MRSIINLVGYIIAFIVGIVLGSTRDKREGQTTMRNDQKHYGIRAIEEFSEGISRDFGIIADINRGVSTRLVWFVAIAGFSFINIPRLASSIVGRELASSNQLLIINPWAITVISSVLAVWILDELK